MSGMFGNADADLAQPQGLSSRLWMLALLSPEPSELLLGGDSQGSIWGRELLAGCPESFLLSKADGCSQRLGGESTVRISRFLLRQEDGLW